ncbi:GNAT family N-acetyltransferase [Streptomyces sp. NPDC006487]|uniref:GNAT family N-acetyltransferase n=1 Tax=Streptomyces sp. NPDC006487 TaxID=3364748 RepID=UPI0036BFA3AC
MHVSTRRPVPVLTAVDIGALAEETLRVQAAALGLAPRALDDRVPERRARGACGLTAIGAFHDGQLAGFTYGVPAHEPYPWREPVLHRLLAAGRRSWTGDAFYLCELHVLPDFQRQGLGTRLLTALCARAGEHRVILTTPAQPTPARRLYHRHGYRDLIDVPPYASDAAPYAIMGAELPLLPEAFRARAA